jgi:small subunit ribosomal protein S8
MSLTDPIADMLTTIRNANSIQKEKLDVPYSRLKEGILKVMKAEGFIRTYKRIEGKPQALLRVYLREEGEKQSSITGVRRISKPGLRIYVPRERIPRVLGGLGIAILSTPKGILTDRQARKERIGGEVLCYLW